jgi:hypothetical protein
MNNDKYCKSTPEHPATSVPWELMSGTSTVQLGRKFDVESGGNKGCAGIQDYWLAMKRFRAYHTVYCIANLTFFLGNHRKQSRCG